MANKDSLEENVHHAAFYFLLCFYTLPFLCLGVYVADCLFTGFLRRIFRVCRSQRIVAHNTEREDLQIVRGLDMQRRAAHSHILRGDEPSSLGMIDPTSIEAIHQVDTIDSHQISLSQSIDGIDMNAVWEAQRQMNATRLFLLPELRQDLGQRLEGEGDPKEFLNREWRRWILERIMVCQPYQPNGGGNTDILKARDNNINESAGSAQTTGAVGQGNERTSGIKDQKEGSKEINSKVQREETDAEAVDGFVMEHKSAETSNERLTTSSGVTPPPHEVREEIEPTCTICLDKFGEKKIQMISFS